MCFLNFYLRLGPLELDIPFWRYFSWEVSSELSLKWKNNLWGGFSESTEVLFIIWRGFGGFWWRKNEEKTERRGSIVKCGEILFEGGLRKSCGSLHVWQSYGNCLYQKLGPSWEVRLAGIGLHTGCKGVSGYYYHCSVLGAIVMACVVKKKKGRFWCEASAGYLPSGSNKVKVWRWWIKFLLVDCCGWVVILVSACMEIC